MNITFQKEKMRGKQYPEIYFSCVCVYNFKFLYRELIAKAKKKKSKPSPATPVPNYNNNAKPDLEFKIRPGSLLVGYHGGERSVIEMAFRRVCREPGKGLEIYRGICLEIYSESMALLEKVSTKRKYS